MKVKQQNKRQKGMTLIEITLVIAILLGLIAILFLGIAAYKKGSDRSKCILQMSTVEKLVISHGNMYEVQPGQPLAEMTLIDPQFAYLPQLYTCPEPTNFAGYMPFEFMPTGTAGSQPYYTCGSATPLHPFDPYPLGGPPFP